VKKSIVLAASLAIFTATSSVQATETGPGCGIGAEIMKGKSGKGANIVAAILNNALIPNTFFMTTGDGLMGCDPTKTVEREQAKKIFVATNLDRLSSDAAKGHGDHLTALAYLVGIEEHDVPAFEALAQSRYDELFASDGSAEEVLASLDRALSHDSHLSRYASQQ